MNKKKGFSVVEIVFVLAVVGILTTFLVPKTKSYLGIAKDTKVINVLNSLRVANTMYELENDSQLNLTSSEKSFTKDDLDKLNNYIDNKIDFDESATEILLSIGGSKDSLQGEVIYGGKIGLYFNSESEIVLKILEGDSAVKEYSIRGEKWEEL